MVVVGDGAVGKTCMLQTYSTGQFPEDYVPTLVDNFSSNVMVRGQSMNLNLWDTAGQEDLAKVRQQQYPGTHVFVLTFSLDRKDSFENIKSLWVPDVRKHAPENVPLILVGTKADLRAEGQAKVTEEEVRQLGQDIGAYAVVECSACQNKRLKEVFIKAAEAHLEQRSSLKKGGEKGSCVLL